MTSSESDAYFATRRIGEGLVFTIEPFLSVGANWAVDGDDGWTLSAEGSPTTRIESPGSSVDRVCTGSTAGPGSKSSKSSPHWVKRPSQLARSWLPAAEM